MFALADPPAKSSRPDAMPPAVLPTSTAASEFFLRWWVVLSLVVCSGCLAGNSSRVRRGAADRRATGGGTDRGACHAGSGSRAGSVGPGGAVDLYYQAAVQAANGPDETMSRQALWGLNRCGATIRAA